MNQIARTVISQDAQERLAIYCLHPRDHDSQTWAKIVAQVEAEIAQERKPPPPVICPPGFQEDHGLPPEGSAVDWGRTATTCHGEEMKAINQIRAQTQVITDTLSSRILRKRQVLKKCLDEYQAGLRKAYAK